MSKEQPHSLSASDIPTCCTRCKKNNDRPDLSEFKGYVNEDPHKGQLSSSETDDKWHLVVNHNSTWDENNKLQRTKDTVGHLHCPKCCEEIGNLLTNA